MTLSWLAPTSQGPMVGDYISTSFTGSSAQTVVALANAPSGGVFDQAMYAPSSSLGVAAVGVVVSHQPPLPDVVSDHAPPAVPTARR